MDDGITPNLSLIKPDVGASDDTWGDKLNHNFDILDGAVQTVPVPLPANNPPLVAGAANPGVSLLYSRGDHVHPNDPTKADVATIGETIDDRVAGLLIAGTNITLTYNDPANTLKIDAAGGGGGGASVTISDNPPGSPTAGNLWWESDSGNLYIYYNDGNSSQWVLVTPQTNAASFGAVTYTPQTPSAAQQVQVQQNIGIASVSSSCGLLAKSGANIALTPMNGNVLTIGGVNATIPDVGVTLAPTGLTVGTLYYIYAVQTNGVVTSLEASTTAYAVVQGLLIKTGDPTRRFVGMVRPIAGPAFSDLPAQRFVRSWLNRRRVMLQGAAMPATGNTNASTVRVETNSAVRVEFLLFGDESADLSSTGTVYNNTSGQSTYSSIGLDSTTAGPFGESGGVSLSSSGADITAGVRVVVGPNLSEGYHFATILGRVSGGVGTWYAGTNHIIYGTIG